MCWVYALLSEKEMCGHLGVSDEPRRGLPEPSRGNPSGHVVSALRRLSIPNATRPGTQRWNGKNISSQVRKTLFRPLKRPRLTI